MPRCTADSRHNVHTLHLFFFFNDPATTEIYTLSLHDALPIFTALVDQFYAEVQNMGGKRWDTSSLLARLERSEEHTSELQSHVNLVCRLLLEKKKKIYCNLFSTKLPKMTVKINSTPYTLSTHY